MDSVEVLIEHIIIRYIAGDTPVPLDLTEPNYVTPHSEKIRRNVSSGTSFIVSWPVTRSVTKYDRAITRMGGS